MNGLSLLLGDSCYIEKKLSKSEKIQNIPNVQKNYLQYVTKNESNVIYKLLKNVITGTGHNFIKM